MFIHSYSQGTELSAGADLHVIIPRDCCCFVNNLVVSLKSHPNQYGLCQINAAILCKQAVILCHCAAILALLYSSK